LNVGEEGRLREEQCWLKPWKEKESRPLPHNRPTTLTATTTTLSKKKPILVACPLPRVFKKKKA
jgi:hypothetical protein